MFVGEKLIQQLKNQYPNCEIYTEKIVQGMRRPCLLLLEQEAEVERQGKERFHFSFPIKILYYPQEMVQNYRENFEMGLSLCEVLQTLPGERLRGRRMQFSQRDGRLEFMVRFEGDYLLREAQGELMRKMTKEVNSGERQAEE